jgi:hypothetical protein
MDASNHETAKVRNHETVTCVIHHGAGPLAGGRGNTCEPTSLPTKTPTPEPVQNASNPNQKPNGRLTAPISRTMPPPKAPPTMPDRSTGQFLSTPEPDGCSFDIFPQLPNVAFVQAPARLRS